jgi:hypothetical protein
MSPRPSVRALAIALVACALGAAGLLACSTILGLGDIRESACLGSDAGDCDGGGDASSDTPLEAAADTAPEVACMPVSVTDAAVTSSCAPIEAGACAPSGFDGGGIDWIPPRVIPGACTIAQIDAFYDACVGPNRTNSTCTAYEHGAATSICYSCIVTDFTQPMLGPLIIFDVPNGGFITELNIAGCIAVLDPCNEACARAVQRQLRCTFETCPSTCFPASGLAACADQAKMCPCADVYAAAKSCADILTAMGGPSTPCDPAGIQFLQQLEVVGNALCGSP